MNKLFYPPILSNNKDLFLGDISLRYRHIENLPNLLTIYELRKPILQAYYEIKHILADLDQNEKSAYAIRGLFILGIAHFETMFSDVLLKYLAFFPEKVANLRSKGGASNKEGKEFRPQQEWINKGNVIHSIIESEVNKLMYSNIREIKRCFYEALSINSEKIDACFDTINEIKETRNLLLHNNLRVNLYYLNNTKPYSRSKNTGSEISIDKPYAINSMRVLLDQVYDILNQVNSKYADYTLINLLKRLWEYTFTNTAIKIENFCVLNTQADSIDGPFNTPDYLGFLSSSETFFWEFWRTQRMGNALNMRLPLLDKRNILKAAFLVEVFGELSFPYWV